MRKIHGVCYVCIYLWNCDGPALPDPSVKAACAAAATGNLELKGGIASHLGVPKLKGARQLACGPENAKQEERRAADEEENAEQEKRRTADEEESPEDVGLWEGEDGWKRGPPVKSQDNTEGRGHVRNTDSGTGGALRRLRQCIRRSVAKPGDQRYELQPLFMTTFNNPQTEEENDLTLF
ncbi:hypothetical protein NDU88_003867 [Pleurodeles waltl]|uniref:Uncharacterized protein n=1 Tax=Pleurodeles waltl TaxID=8319 RepID=A0AAV7UHA1_PLEWA|nr:hypothetical protein NDU88_003867 [Pleurodeles waltl]